MSIRVVSPINEKNSSQSELCEKANEEFYAKVENGTFDDIEQFNKYYEYDIYAETSSGKEINVNNIMSI